MDPDQDAVTTTAAPATTTQCSTTTFPPAHCSPTNPSAEAPVKSIPAVDPLEASCQNSPRPAEVPQAPTTFEDPDNTIPLGTRRTRNGNATKTRLIEEGIAACNAFLEQVERVGEEFLNLTNSGNRLPESTRLISAGNSVMLSLRRIAMLFQLNAESLFPNQSHSLAPVSAVGSGRSPTGIHTRVKPGNQSPWSKFQQTYAIANTKQIPEEMEVLAVNLQSFATQLHEVLDAAAKGSLDMTDERITGNIANFEDFEADLKYWASGLHSFQGQFRNPAVELYLNDLTREMFRYLHDIENSLRFFIEMATKLQTTVGQNRTIDGFQSLSSAATFFSAVTATTIQYTYQPNLGNVAACIVNGLWISSLIFSIGSAINSQIAYQWRVANFRSPINSIPWWISIWLTTCPLLFLVISVLSFSSGLVLWTFASGQHPVVCIVASAFTAITTISLLVAALWFAGERWTFTRTKGRKTFVDVIHSIQPQARNETAFPSEKAHLHVPSIFAGKAPVNQTSNHRQGLRQSLRSRGSRLEITIGAFFQGLFQGKSRPMVHDPHRRSATIDVEAQEEGKLAPNPRWAKDSPRSPPEATLPIHDSEDLSAPFPTNSPGYPSKSEFDTKPEVIQAIKDTSMSIPTVILSGESDQNGHPAQGTPSQTLAALRKAVVQIGRAAYLQRLNCYGDRYGRPGPSAHPRDHTYRITQNQRGLAELVNLAILKNYSESLKQIRLVKALKAHDGYVRDIQFSPNGKLMCSIGCDKTAAIWDLVNHGTGAYDLYHRKTLIVGPVHQIAWSPDSKHILTREPSNVKLWDPLDYGSLMDKARIQVDRDEPPIEAVAWDPSSGSFFVVQGPKVQVHDLDGALLRFHQFDNLSLQDCIITSDAKRLILLATRDKPVQVKRVQKKPRLETRIVVYDLESLTIMYQVPLFDDVSSIAISSDNRNLLLTYTGEVFPEVWKLQSSPGHARLIKLASYGVREKLRFVGRSYFGGQGGELVVCAGNDGKIYIWDRETGDLLHTLPAFGSSTEGTKGEGLLTAIAWNHAVPDTFMLATGLHDGILQFWTLRRLRGFLGVTARSSQ